MQRNAINFLAFEVFQKELTDNIKVISFNIINMRRKYLKMKMSIAERVLLPMFTSQTNPKYALSRAMLNSQG